MNNQQSLNLNNTIPEVVREMLKEMTDWPYADLQNRIKYNLQKMFQRYTTLEASQRKRLDLLIVQHRDYCLRESKDQYVREHDSFVLHYVNGMSTKSIARSQAINSRTVSKDIDVVLDRMLIFLLGFYGIRWDRKTKNK